MGEDNYEKNDNKNTLKEQRKEKKKKKKKKKSVSQDLSFFKIFFTKYTIPGFILVLISIIIDSYNVNSIFVFNVIRDVINTIGTAVLVGAIFDFSKNSEAFTTFVSNILKKIVVSKEFLGEMNETEKKNALELILRPTNLQIEQCSSIDLYYKKSIDSFMNLYQKPFKTDLVITIEIKKEDGRIVTMGNMTHRIYKVNGEYRPIITSFERDHCEILETSILLPNGEKYKLKNTHVKEKHKDELNELEKVAVLYETNIPRDFYDHSYLTICREIYERGYYHWTNFHWTALTACDGIYFKLHCRDGITIKDYLVFDDKALYDITMNEEKTTLQIIANNWLDAYSGFTITASDTADESVEEVNLLVED